MIINKIMRISDKGTVLLGLLDFDAKVGQEVIINNTIKARIWWIVTNLQADYVPEVKGTGREIGLMFRDISKLEIEEGHELKPI